MEKHEYVVKKEHLLNDPTTYKIGSLNSTITLSTNRVKKNSKLDPTTYLENKSNDFGKSMREAKYINDVLPTPIFLTIMMIFVRVLYKNLVFRLWHNFLSFTFAIAIHNRAFLNSFSVKYYVIMS